jgi:hypothetical protein
MCCGRGRVDEVTVCDDRGEPCRRAQFARAAVTTRRDERAARGTRYGSGVRQQSFCAVGMQRDGLRSWRSGGREVGDKRDVAGGASESYVRCSVADEGEVSGRGRDGEVGDGAMIGDMMGGMMD